MFKVSIETIPHNNQRYETCGDWQFDHIHNRLIIKVSDLGDWKMEACLAFHEMIEAIRCESDGITEHQVDVWDSNFKGDGEPGDDPKAPYHKEHVEATRCERVMARQLGVDWEKYEKKLNSLVYKGVLNVDETANRIKPQTNP